MEECSVQSLLRLTRGFSGAGGGDTSIRTGIEDDETVSGSGKLLLFEDIDFRALIVCLTRTSNS
jgi:hypothetical protein